MVRWILMVGVLVSASGCATFKAAEPQLVLCAEGMANQDTISKLVTALEAQQWPLAVAVALQDLGQAGVCALQAIANVHITAGATVSAAALGVNDRHVDRAACWLAAHAVRGIAAAK